MVTRTQAIYEGLKHNKIIYQTPKYTFDSQTVLNLLSGLTYDNNGTAAWGNLVKQNLDLVKALIDYFSQNPNINYGNSRGSLIDNYGQYCNYCDMPVQDSSLAVEHCLPKAQFPALMLNYSNFFLACPMCNSFKGSKPTFHTAKSWAENEMGKMQPDMQDINAAGIDRQLWPDNPRAFIGLQPFLWDVTNNNHIPDANAFNLNSTLVSYTDNTVIANISGYNNNKPTSIYVAFSPVPNTSDLLDQEREENFIDIVKLNEDPKSFADRRATNRTIAWMNALQSLQTLHNVGTASPFFAPLLDQILVTAKQAGYYSIWAYLFYSIAGPSNPSSVYTTFKTKTSNPANLFMYFPGTNIANMP